MSSTEPPPSGSSSSSTPSSGASAGAAGSQAAAAPRPSPSPSPPPSAPQQGIFARRFPRGAAAAGRLAASTPARFAATGWRRRRGIFFGVAVTFSVVSYLNGKAIKAKADYVHNDTWLLWKLHDGAIVETRSPTQLLTLLRGAGAGEDPPAVMELYDAIKTLKLAQTDPRIRGLIADFSGLHVPSDSAGTSLGLAQIEELTQAIHEFKAVKNEELKVRAELRQDLPATLAGGAEISGPTKAAAVAKAAVTGESTQEPKTGDAEPTSEVTKAEETPLQQLPATIAWTDTFTSQGQYLLASAFDHVYIQPSGSVPLVGMSSTLPFFKRALDWLGVKLYADARREHKSFLSQYTEDGSLTEPQIENTAALLGDLNRGMAHAIGVSRYPEMNPDEAADKVIELSMRGPFSATEAAKEGLVTATIYPFELREKIGKEAHFKGFPHYATIYKGILEDSLKKGQYSEVAVVYLQGTISNASGFGSAAEAIKGLQEAGKDDRVKSVVLRIDSGGGDVVASDSIWAAVRRCQTEHKKPVIASYGNATASGGVYASASADYIMACEQTITGSIGVASLRPTLTRKLFDRVGLQFQSFFTGSRTASTLQELDDEAKRRSSLHVDEMYEQFKQKVCDGRGISPDVIEDLAGGRVYSGLSAWLRCKSDEDLIRESAVDEGPAQADAGSDVQAKKDATPRRPLRLSWRTQSIEKEGDFSALQVIQVGAAPAESSPSAPQSDAPEASGTSESSAADAAPVKAEQAVGGETSDDKLAAAAHEEAVAEKESPAATGPGSTAGYPAEEPKGPYGRGLVDSFGGLYDAVCIAMSIEVQRDIERRVVEEKLTLEDATAAALSERASHLSLDGEGGKAVMSTDLRAVRYPRQLTFWQRVRKMQSPNEPSFSMLQPLSAFGHALAETAAQSFIRRLCSSEAWSRAVQHELAAQSGMRSQDPFAASMRP